MGGLGVGSWAGEGGGDPGLRGLRHQFARATRLQARGIKATATLARNNNALLARLDSRLGGHVREVEGLKSVMAVGGGWGWLGSWLVGW